MNIHTIENTSKEMYTVKPFYDIDMKVNVPDVIYKVKSFHVTDDSDKMDGLDSRDPLLALEHRQDAMLAKLGDMRTTLDRLAGRYSCDTITDPATTNTQGRAPPVTASYAAQKVPTTVDNPLNHGIHDVVISADPRHPPLSLFVLYELLKKQFRVLATTYVHSSVTNVDPRLREVIKTGCQVVRGSHQLALSVIWKQACKELIRVVNPFNTTDIYKENVFKQCRSR